MTVPDDLSGLSLPLWERFCADPPVTTKKPPEQLVRSAFEDRELVEAVRPLVTGDEVLDLGCGFGRLALAFAGGTCRYVGLDVNADRLAYARRLFEGCADVEFHLVDAGNGHYNPSGEGWTDLGAYRRDGGRFAAAFAVSVFTHIPDLAEIEHLLAGLRGALVDGGALLSTWMTDPPRSSAGSTARRATQKFDWVESALTSAGFEVCTRLGEGSEASQLRLVSAATVAGRRDWSADFSTDR